MGELKRTQIQLEKWQHEKLRRRAEEEGMSMSELLRDLLDKEFESGDRLKRLRRIRGIGSDEEVSGKDHDQVLYGE